VSYNPKMETQKVDEDRVYYHKKLKKALVLESGHPEDGALYLMREYDMFNGDFLDDPNCIIYYGVEKTDLWPTCYSYGIGLKQLEELIAQEVRES